MKYFFTSNNFSTYIATYAPAYNDLANPIEGFAAFLLNRENLLSIMKVVYK